MSLRDKIRDLVQAIADCDPDDIIENDLVDRATDLILDDIHKTLFRE